ncbi:hypothetical protein FGSG_08437 [Fusarium graminearum PH-1]|uniref:hypothetical protein n=1 Tax=Gibberella zeae (strain ATCC MYA-4620 / CBS 123657 / FGSC 9075 / NRRL 31084 / PH-1) TaxID=229533 RepID=UPI000023D8B1|nr:hypothetical protein FGSG_08437 [Fusarium graminearum PH-1]ESU14909.1 hypothetical protein FGSG_08437 [Fusarium graminearum PH-1]|eukprot:XP_011320334.1 hypothetical protein FGSG_08437 [Fusarium graminearum PH-1]
MQQEQVRGRQVCNTPKERAVLKRKMPYDYTCSGSNVVIITHWGPLASKGQYESHGPYHIAAVVYGRGDKGIVSYNIAEKLQITDGKQVTKVPPVVWISWTFKGLNQNLETSQVRIVPGLKQDLVLGDSTDEIYRSFHISTPEETVSHQFITRNDFEKHGILTANKRSENKLKSLISLYLSKTQLDKVKSDVASSKPEEIERPSESSSELSPGSTLDSISNTGTDADNWVMDFGNSIPSGSLPQLSYLDTPDQTCGTCCNSAAHLGRTHSKPGLKDCDEDRGWEVPHDSVSHTSQADSPMSNWSFVNKEPGEMKDQEVIQQCQRSDFETHPGHSFWVWDRQRQLWRRRGRSGLDERDWFTELPRQ